ncbi:hypothetical protein MYIN104542_12080 [Mycobacterium intermedium]
MTFWRSPTDQAPRRTVAERQHPSPGTGCPAPETATRPGQAPPRNSSSPAAKRKPHCFCPIGLPLHRASIEGLRRRPRPVPIGVWRRRRSFPASRGRYSKACLCRPSATPTSGPPCRPRPLHRPLRARPAPTSRTDGAMGGGRCRCTPQVRRGNWCRRSRRNSQMRGVEHRHRQSRASIEWRDRTVKCRCRGLGWADQP